MRRTLSPRELAALQTLTEVDGFRASVRAIVSEMDARCATSDYHVQVVYGARTAEEQDRLFAQGRTAPGPRVTNARGGQSAHCYAAAADVALVRDDGKGWLSGDHPAWLDLAELLRAQGLITGSDFSSFKDRAHMEMRGWIERARQGALALYHGRVSG